MIYVIACHNTDNTDYIIPCIQSINQTQSVIHKIVIVDSASPNKDYIPKAKNLGAAVYEAENKNYDFGAYWKGVNYLTAVTGLQHIMKETNILFTHDSTLLKKDISLNPIIGQQLFTPFYWFNSNRNPAMETHYQWVLKQLADRQLTRLPDKEFCVFGPLFTASYNFLLQLMKFNIDQIKPQSKWEAVYAGELLLGLAAYNLGIDVKRSALYGQLGTINTPEAAIWKFSGIQEKGRT